MACIVCVEWEETTGRRAGATRSAHRIGLTYRMGRPRSARRPGVISPVRWNGGIPHADLFDRRRHLPGSMERGGPFRSSLGRRRRRFLGSRNRLGTTLPAILAGGAVCSHFIRGIRFRNPRGASSSRFAQSTPVGSETAKRATAAQRTSPSRIARLWIAIELNETATPAAVIAHVSHGIPFSDTATALPNRAIETGVVMIVDMMDLRRAPIKPEISMSVSLSVGAVEGVVSSSSGARDRRWCRRERSRRR